MALAHRRSADRCTVARLLAVQQPAERRQFVEYAAAAGESEILAFDQSQGGRIGGAAAHVRGQPKPAARGE